MTMFIQHTIESAPEASQPLLEGVKKAFGFVPNLLATLAEAPASVEAYLIVSDIFGKTTLNAAEQQVVLIATSIENSCEYCVAAHSTIAKNFAGVDASIVEALRDGEVLPDANLDALANFTRAVVRERGFVSEPQLNSFLSAGYTKQSALDVIVGVAQKTISNYSNHLASIPVDVQFSAETWSATDRNEAA